MSEAIETAEWFRSTWISIGFVFLIVLALVVKFYTDRKAIKSFQGDDLEYLKIPATDFYRPRIVKRANAMGWELIRVERNEQRRCDELIFKAGEDAKPLSVLLMKLNRSGFLVNPKRGKLNCDGNCEENNAQKN